MFIISLLFAVGLSYAQDENLSRAEQLEVELAQLEADIAEREGRQSAAPVQSEVSEERKITAAQAEAELAALEARIAEVEAELERVEETREEPVVADEDFVEEQRERCRLRVEDVHLGTGRVGYSSRGRGCSGSRGRSRGIGGSGVYVRIGRDCEDYGYESYPAPPRTHTPRHEPQVIYTSPPEVYAPPPPEALPDPVRYSVTTAAVERYRLEAQAIAQNDAVRVAAEQRAEQSAAEAAELERQLAAERTRREAAEASAAEAKRVSDEALELADELVAGIPMEEE